MENVHVPDVVPDITLGEMVKILVAKLHQMDVPLPFRDQRPWHLLFYELKEKPAAGRPSFLDELIFDWDGYYPKSEELAGFLNALHVTANVAAQNPRFNTIRVDDADSERWARNLDTLGPDVRKFVEGATDHARERFRGEIAG
jgi:hypothetical protein